MVEGLSERRLPLEGCFNFRDLGGYAAADGRSVRWQTLFRSDSLHHATRADVELVVDTLGVRTLVDLRDGNEARDGEAWRASGIDRVSLPIIEALRTAEQPNSPLMPAESVPTTIDRSPPATAARYEIMLRGAGHRFIAAIEAFARPGALPAVFYCAAGKDRTGLLAAIVLGVLGVDDDDIVADYALSARFVDGIIERLRLDPLYEPGMRGVPMDAFRPSAETMQRVTTAIRRDFGSWSDYALQHGLRPQTADFLRDTLLD